MILTCNILKLKEKIRYLPMKSYVIMTEISAERFLEILKTKNRTYVQIYYANKLLIYYDSRIMILDLFFHKIYVEVLKT